MALSTPLAAVKRRAKNAGAPVMQDAATASTSDSPPPGPNAQQAPNPNPVTPAAHAAAALPSAAVWQNPYPTTYVPVPIASPPANPDLTPQDVAAQTAEYADWDKYITGIGLTAANLAASTSSRIRDIQQGVAQSLDSNNWDTAARGLAQSSIRQNNAAQTASSAANQQSDAEQQLGNYESQFATELANWSKPGGLKETIDNKYLGVAAANRAARVPPPAPVVDTPAPPPAPAPAPPAAPAPAPAPAQYSITQVSPETPGHPGVYIQDHGPRAGLRYIIKNGGQKWYESKAGAGDWGKGGKIGAGGP
jgi:hypothetical protein